MAKKPAQVESGDDALPDLPPETIKGVANPEYYRARLAEVNQLARKAILGQDRLPFNYESIIKGIKTEAELAGISERELQDRRSDADKVVDAMEKLCSEETSDHWLATDEELRAVLNAMAKTFMWSKDVLEEWKVNKALGDVDIYLPNDDDFDVGKWPLAVPPGGDKESRGKAMAVRIRRMLRARHLARADVP